MKTPHTTTDAIHDRLLRLTTTPQRPLHDDFTSRITAHINTHPRKQRWYSHMTRPLHALITRLQTLPRLAAAALVVAIPTSIGGAAYVAYQWVKPNVTITQVTPSNDAGNREYNVTAICGDYLNGSFRFEVSPHSTVTDEDAQKVLSNTCTYDAVLKFARETWQGDNGNDDFAKKKVGDITTLYGTGNILLGDNQQSTLGLGTGIVTALDESHITISAQVYQTNSADGGTITHATPVTKTATLDMLSDYQTWQDGKQIARTDLRVGDTVQLVTREQHKVQYYDDIKQNALGEQTSFGVAAIIRLQVDLAYVMFQPFGNPALTTALSEVNTCHNNPDFICTTPLDSAYGQVYSALGDDPLTSANKQYLRKDALSGATQSYTIDGRVTAIDGKQLTIQTRGTVRSIRITLPYDAVAEYNARAANSQQDAQMGSVPLSVGDMVSVMYLQTADQDHSSIAASDIENLGLVMYRSGNSLYKY